METLGKRKHEEKTVERKDRQKPAGVDLNIQMGTVKVVLDESGH
jgi:hypothetical protein